MKYCSLPKSTTWLKEVGGCSSFLSQPLLTGIGSFDCHHQMTLCMHGYQLVPSNGYLEGNA